MPIIANPDLTQKVIELGDRLSALSSAEANRLYFVGTGTDAMRIILSVELSKWGESVGVFFPGLDWDIYKESSRKNLETITSIVPDRHKVIETYVDLLNEAIDFVQRNSDNVAIVPSTLDVKVRTFKFGSANEEYVVEFRNRIYGHTVAVQREMFIVPTDTSFQSDPIAPVWTFIRACHVCQDDYNYQYEVGSITRRCRVVYNDAYSDATRGQLYKNQRDLYEPFDWAWETSKQLKALM